MTNFGSVDYFTDQSLVLDPHPYFYCQRNPHPVGCPINNGVPGVHSCPGAPLARVEGRVSIERILDRLANITIDEERHGPAGQRKHTYEPTFILRGVTDLHIKFTPSGNHCR